VFEAYACIRAVACAGIFFQGRVQQIQLTTEGRENGDLGAVAPYSGVPLNLQMNETHILIRLLCMRIRLSFVKTSEFLGGGLNPHPRMPLRYRTQH
jgi:hypothetical protein